MNITSIAEILCELVLPRKRDPFDCEIDDHLWYLEFGQEVCVKNSKRQVNWSTKVKTSADHHDEDDEEEEFRRDRKKAIVQDRRPVESLHLNEGDVGRFTYDYGDTTAVYIKVIAICVLDDFPVNFPKIIKFSSPLSDVQRRMLVPLSTGNLKFMNSGFDVTARFVFGDEDKEKILLQIPASKLAKKRQLDTIFPLFSAAVMSKELHRGFTLGLSDMFHSEADALFSSMSGDACDQFIARQVFRSMDEFLAIAERAFTPGSEMEEEYSSSSSSSNSKSRKLNAEEVNLDPNSVRKGWIMKQVTPTQLNTEFEAFHQMLKKVKNDDDFGPVSLFFRFKTQPKKGHGKTFIFAEHFPRTNHFLTDDMEGRFRWISFKAGVLRVCCGRASGERDCSVVNILREWQGVTFTSFHELMCAVEASWVVPGESASLLLDDTLLLCDQDTGPSLGNTLPTIFDFEKSAPVVLQPYMSVSERINFFAWGEKNGGSHWLYSAGGNLIKKWDLNTNTLVKTIDANDDVLGFLVASNHRLYFWTYKPDEVVVCDCSGVKLRKLGCFTWNLGYQIDEEDEDVLVQSKVRVNVGVLASIARGHFACERVLGMHCYSDPRRSEVGNILLMNASNGDTIGTFRGHTCPITALSIVSNQFLVSIGTSFKPDEFIIWRLDTQSQAGKIIRSLHLDDDKVLRRFFYRGICGMTVRYDDEDKSGEIVFLYGYVLTR